MRSAYKLIKDIYGDQTTVRSGVLLINHIDEGLVILDKLGSSDVVKDAYCLHPILQSDEAFVVGMNNPFTDIPVKAVILAMEYRRVANSYLSKDIPSSFVGFSCIEVKEMLIADKVQNYKDFLKYHYGTHERSDELYNYFNTWFDLLEIDYNEYVSTINE